MIVILFLKKQSALSTSRIYHPNGAKTIVWYSTRQQAIAGHRIHALNVVTNLKSIYNAVHKSIPEKNRFLPLFFTFIPANPLLARVSEIVFF